jgi:hypothetical protein
LLAQQYRLVTCMNDIGVETNTFSPTRFAVCNMRDCRNVLFFVGLVDLHTFVKFVRISQSDVMPANVWVNMRCNWSRRHGGTLFKQSTERTLRWVRYTLLFISVVYFVGFRPDHRHHMRWYFIYVFSYEYVVRNNRLILDTRFRTIFLLPLICSQTVCHCVSCVSHFSSWITLKCSFKKETLFIEVKMRRKISRFVFVPP